MDSVLLDTNIILDYLIAQRPCHQNAVDLLYELIDSSKFEAAISISSVKDAYYILCRALNHEPLIRQRLADFCQIVRIVDLTKDILDTAFVSNEVDVEDGIIRATAESIGAVALITRDAAAYQHSKVGSMDAATFLAQLS